MGDKVYNLTAPLLDMYRFSTKLKPDKTMMDPNWFKNNSQCQVQKDYQWGFSSLLLFTFCIASIIYASVLAALHIDIWFSSQTNQSPVDFHLYRDILDFASEIQSNLEDAGMKKEADIPANDLAKVVDADSSGMSVSAYDYPSSRAQTWRQTGQQDLKRMGTELKANHTYSWQETKRVWGKTYGPIPKPGSTFDRNVGV